jgi:hypothetical protein
VEEGLDFVHGDEVFDHAGGGDTLFAVDILHVVVTQSHFVGVDGVMVYVEAEMSTDSVDQALGTPGLFGN